MGGGCQGAKEGRRSAETGGRSGSERRRRRRNVEMKGRQRKVSYKEGNERRKVGGKMEG